MRGLVSIIMPNYNSAKFLDETISSVLSQTYTNWELLIVDDCSTDVSLEIIKQYQEKDERIRLFQNTKNEGAAYSRNVALNNAKGEWIAFLDSDDLWFPDKLEEQINFMISNGYDFSYTLYEQIDESSTPIGKIITGPTCVTKNKMLHYDYLGCLTVMYNHEKVGNVNVDPKIGNGRNDYALWIKVSKICNCYLLNKCLAQYRLRKSSLSHGKFFKLIRYHYEMFRISENMGIIKSSYYTLVNLFFGFWKKMLFKKR